MIGVMGACSVLASVALLCIRRIDIAVWLCALQSLCAAAALTATGKADIAIAAFVLNGIALPLALRRAANAATVSARINGMVLWAAALAAIIVSAASLPTIGLALGASTVLFGCLLSVRSPLRLPRVVGLLSAQNGLLLVAAGVPSLPLATGWVLALPLLPALSIADAWRHE